MPVPHRTPAGTVVSVMGRTTRVVLAAAAVLTAPTAARADDVHVMTSGALAATHLAMVAKFERATGHRVITEATSTGLGADSITSRLRRGDPVDVVILADDRIGELIEEGRLASDSRVALARSGIGMAVRKGALKPDISSVDALKQALLNAKSIAYSAQVSGIYLETDLFVRLGVADQIKGRSLRVQRERVGAVVARGEADVGFQQISELLPVEGIDYVGPLPPEVQRLTLFSAGVSVGARNPSAARAFIRFLLTPDGVEAMTRYGLEPVSSRP